MPSSAIRALTPYSWAEATSFLAGSGAVEALVDMVKPGTGIRAVDASHSYVFSGTTRAAYPAPSAAFQGRNVLTTVAAADTAYVSSASASAWRFLHDGTGATLYCVFSANSGDTVMLFGARGTPGAWMASVGGLIRHQVYDDSGTNIASTDTAASLVTDVASIACVSYATASTPDITLSLGEDVATSNAVSAASTDDGAAMTLFRLQGGTPYYFVGRFACLLVFNRVLSGAEDTTVRSYLARWGV